MGLSGAMHRLPFSPESMLPPAVEADKRKMEPSRHLATISLQEFSQITDHRPNHSKSDQADQAKYRRSRRAFSRRYDRLTENLNRRVNYLKLYVYK
jgi:hypothetical protein